MSDKITCENYRGQWQPIEPCVSEANAAGLRYPWRTIEAARFEIERAGYEFSTDTASAESAKPAKKSAPKSRKAETEAQKKQATKEYADKHETREAWLLAAIELFRPWFKQVNATIPAKVYASCGWALGTRKAIGQAFYAAHCADGSHAVFVSPVIADAARVLDILIHELCHTALEAGIKHKAPFAKLAASLGLVKPWTATTASPDLVERLRPILAELGNYPHAKLDSAKREKQSTRLLKAECKTCGYPVRVTAKWLDQAGLPHCPIHGEMVCDSWQAEEGNE